jgi:hypothetical protein
MASSQTAVAPARTPILGRNGWLDKYFYFSMSFVFAATVVIGFSQTVNSSLFHATPPRPLLLWIHGAAFSAWVVFYIFQSSLVRARKVRWHRFLGWFGVGLGTLMVALGFVIAIIMGRFDAVVLHRPDPGFLSVPFYDMIAFAALVWLAIAWRRKPELHRRLLFLATCSLMDAPFGRFDFLFDNNLTFVCLDGLMLLGVARDLLVNRRVHTVYRIALPLLFVGEAFTIYLYRGAPAWWMHFTRGILG